MFQVYLAGPIAGLSYQSATNWRESVTASLEWSGDIRALSPLRQQQALSGIQNFTASGDETQRYGDPMSLPQGFTARDRRDAQTCDVLFVNLLGAEKVSIGTVLEIAWADAMRTPIVLCMEAEGNPHEHAMINEICAFRCTTIEQGIRTTKAILAVEDHY